MQLQEQLKQSNSINDTVNINSSLPLQIQELNYLKVNQLKSQISKFNEDYN